MDFNELFEILEFVSAFLLILFSVFILNQDKGDRLSRIFLAGFLLSRAMILIGFGLWNYDSLVEYIPDLFLAGEPFLYAYAPFLFLYTQAATSRHFRMKWIHILHAFPFMVILGYLLVEFHFQGLDEKIQMVREGSWYHPLIFHTNWLWIQFAAYAIACIYLMISYKVRILQYNSSYNRKKLAWLNFLIIAFLVWKAIFISGYLFKILGGAYHVYFKLFIELGFLFYASMIVYKGLQWPKVVLGVEGDRIYQTSPLSNEVKQDYLQKLEQFMKQEKPYLNPDLTITELSGQCAIPVHHISQIINEELGFNFYSYINKYRIEEAKKILSDPVHKEMTILEILYEVGFNSKSVFHNAFKKHVKMTPSNFKKQHLRIA